jgi:hypothetical protein
MRTSNKLTREALDLNTKVLKGTVAAVVVADIGFDANSRTLNLAFVNHGKLITNTTADYEIVQLSL